MSMDKNRVRSDMFSTPEKMKKAIVELQGLQVAPGWVLLEKILNDYIDTWGNAILDSDRPENEKLDSNGLTIKKLKEKRKLFLAFKNMPQVYIDQLNRALSNDSGEPDDEVYE